MQLRKTIYVPVLNDKNLYVFVIGVLERRRDGRMSAHRFQKKTNKSGFRRKTNKSVTTIFRLAANAAAFQFGSVFVMIIRCL